MTTTHIPTPSEDVIDSRDGIAAIEAEAGGDAELLALLVDLHGEGTDASPDWEYGATLVREDYFVHYAMELADDCGLIPDDAAWPLNCIDWTHAAFELQMDYTPVKFGYVTYWVR